MDGFQILWRALFSLLYESRRIDTRGEWFHVYRDNITFVTEDGVHIPLGKHGFKIECSQSLSCCIIT